MGQCLSFIAINSSFFMTGVFAMFFKLAALRVLLYVAFLASTVGAEWPCHSGFVSFDGHCYGYFKTTMTFWDAQRACKKLHAYLAEPRTHGQNVLIKGLLYENGANNAYVWLGARDKDFGFAWETDDQGVASDGYTNWEHDHTGTTDSLNDCMALYQTHWVEHICETKYTYICQYNAKNGTGVVVG